jgi:hypothetical protein
MKLRPAAYDELEAALIDALDEADLRRVVRKTFNQELGGLVADGSLNNRIHDVIHEAEKADEIAGLALSTLVVRPTNQSIGRWWRTWSAQVAPTPQQIADAESLLSPVQPGGPASQTITNPRGSGSGLAIAADRGARSQAKGLATLTAPPEPGVPSQRGPDSLYPPWEFALDDAWSKIWELVRALLGDTAREDLRNRLTTEMRQVMGATTPQEPNTSAPQAAPRTASLYSHQVQYKKREEEKQ